MRRAAAALARAVLELLYWSAVLAVFVGAVAGDRRADARPPTAAEQYAVPVAIVAVALLVHAALDLLIGRRLQTTGKEGGR